MYYENKRQFYISQYGPATLVVIISIVLITSGIYLTLNSNSIPKTEVAKKDIPQEVVETSSYKYTELAEKGEVTGVNNLAVVVKTENGTMEVNLIGVKLNANYPKLSDKIKTDLIGKKVTIDYDVQKTINGKIYGYVYSDNSLYNEDLLEGGYCELKAERTNVNKLDVLVQAQIAARNKTVGIWQY